MQIERGFEVVPDALRRFKTIEKLLKLNKKKPAYKRPSTIFNLLKNVKDEYAKKKVQVFMKYL